MYETLKRLYKNSYDPVTGAYNDLILTRAVAKTWISTEEKAQIIAETI